MGAWRAGLRNAWVLALVIAGGLQFCPQNCVFAKGPGKKFAFLVGINNFKHAKLDPLEYAERDVEELAVLLKAQGYSVILLTASKGKQDEKLIPNRKNIDDRLQELLKGVGREDQIIVGLAGHGMQPDGSADSYFCPLDANPSIDQGQGTEPAKVLFPETLISITGKQGLLRTLDNSGVGRKLLLIDACRNDPESGRGRGIGSTITELPERTWLLLSCSARQRAWETSKLGGGHGVFFHFVLEGLRGQAADAKGRVTWQQLSQYVYEQVEATVPRIIGDGATQSPDEKRSGSGVPILAEMISEAHAALQKAKELKAASKYQEALKELTRAISLDAKSAEAFAERAWIHNELQNYTDAFDSAEAALRLDERQEMALNEIVYVLERKRNSTRARTVMEILNRRIANDPKSPASIYQTRGRLHKLNGDYSKTVSDLSKAIELEPNDGNLYYERGSAYFLNHKDAMGISDLTKAIEMKPKQGKFYIQRGICYKSMKEFDKALADLDKAISLNPRVDGTSVWSARGEVFLEKGDSDKAILDFTKAIEVAPTDYWNYQKRAEAYEKKGLSEKARLDKEKARKLKS